MTEQPTQDVATPRKPGWWIECDLTPTCLAAAHKDGCPPHRDPKPGKPTHSHDDDRLTAYCPACVDGYHAELAEIDAVQEWLDENGFSI